jgi:hypothetical protein
MSVVSVPILGYRGFPKKRTDIRAKTKRNSDEVVDGSLDKDRTLRAKFRQPTIEMLALVRKYFSAPI